MKYKLSDINLSNESKIIVPDILHFVWVGDTNRACPEYMRLWKSTNPGKKILFWHDPDSSLSHLLNDSIEKYITSIVIDDRIETERRLRNEAFEYIVPKLAHGFIFDDCVNAFLRDAGLINKNITSPVPDNFIKDPGIIVKNIKDLFVAKLAEFKVYYYYELILRGNFASASDIVRLLIIYQYGGIYIDMDTLPYTDNAFKNLNLFLSHTGFIEDDFLRVFKTTKILNRISKSYTDESEYYDHYNSNKSGKYDIEFYKRMLESLNVDISGWQLEVIDPLGNFFVHKNLLSLGAVKRFKGVYFNSIILSHPYSKALRLILCTMRKRYRFIEKHDCIFNFYKGNKEGMYLSRTLNWRTELSRKDYHVTSIMTGPGLIIEVLLGFAYEVLEVDDSTTPSSIAGSMHNEQYGIAFFKHNLDTPQGVFSSWRK